MLLYIYSAYFTKNKTLIILRNVQYKDIIHCLQQQKAVCFCSQGGSSKTNSVAVIFEIELL